MYDLAVPGDQILDILACVESNASEPFEVIEPQIAELMNRISTVICVFLDWHVARQAFDFDGRAVNRCAVSGRDYLQRRFGFVLRAAVLHHLLDLLWALDDS